VRRVFRLWLRFVFRIIGRWNRQVGRVDALQVDLFQSLSSRERDLL
jgi:hypothetical protein